MARDPDEGGAFVFDLVDDDEALEAPITTPGTEDDGDPDGSGAAPGEPPPRAAPSGTLRVLAPAAAVLAIVLGTGFAVEGVRDSARIERMRDVHGGVVDVTSPLEETWAWDGSVGPFGAMDDGRWNEVAVLGGLLAFQSGEDLVALEPATGDEAWRVRLGENPYCGPQGTAGWGEVVTPRLVCLSDGGTGTDAGGSTEAGVDRVAVVVGPDGAVSAGRTLGAADTRRYGAPRPGPDGMVLRARRVGSEARAGANDAECTRPGECSGTVTAGRGLRLRAEDAVTGEERWSVTVPFRPTPADQCANWYATHWDGSSNVMDLDGMIDREGFGARIAGDLVQFFGCGIESAVTSGGVRLDAGIEPGTGGVESLRTGGYVGYSFDGTMETILYDADGGVVREVDGVVLQPMAVDGSEPDTLLASEEPGAGVRSLGLDGTQRWELPAPADAQMFLAQAGGAAIFQTGPGEVRAVDLATGAARWTWSSAEPGEEDSGDIYVSRAFTDGQSVLLVVETSYGGRGLVAVDAVSGEVAWDQRGSEVGTDGFPRPSAGLVAVDGNLLEVAPGGVRGLG